MHARGRTAIAAVLAVATLLVAPPTGAQERPSGPMAVIGDFGTDDVAERRVADLVARQRPSVVITTGDNVYDDADYARRVGDYYGRWVDAGTFLPVAGNHDYAEGIEAFDDYFGYLKGLRTYTRIVGDVQYFMLDSEAALASAADRAMQRDWLARWIPRSTTAWQVVVLHHPPYSSGAEHGSTPEFQWPFRQWGADLVLSGHEHQYERIVRDGVTYVVNGAGGRALYPFGTRVPGSRVRYDRDHGALFLTASPRALIGEFRSASGSRIDRFTLVASQGNRSRGSAVSRP